MKAKWAMTELLFVGFLKLFLVRIHALCEDPPVIWRINNITCPDRAVCAEVFLTSRTLQDGGQCEESRTIHNCLCPGGTACPVNNPGHLMYASAKHLQYTCQKVCQLPYCSNVRHLKAVSQTVQQNAPDFGGLIYIRMNCRCPGHHVPALGGHRSVHAHSHRYNIHTQGYSAEYICNVRGNENLMPDPCEI